MSPTTSTMAPRLEAERLAIEKVLERISSEAAAESVPALREPIAYALSTRGKRIRPILTVAAYRAVSSTMEVPDAVYRVACAVEIVHTYSLVHDDLPSMDDDDMRRGRPTVHRVHGVAAAIAAGAALLPLAVRVLASAAADLGFGDAGAARLVVELTRAAGAEGMVGGQLRDLQAEGREISGDELEAIHRAKTGALLTAALRIGGMAAGAGPEALTALTRYGEAIGLAFQITDDILDVEGDSAALGKAAGRDAALSKASYPSIFGLQRAREMARARADEAISGVAELGAEDLMAVAEYVVARES